MPDVRTSSSQAGDLAVRALFISPNRKDPSALLVTSLRTVRGGSQANGEYATNANRSTNPRRAMRHTAVVPRRTHGLTSRARVIGSMSPLPGSATPCRATTAIYRLLPAGLLH